MCVYVCILGMALLLVCVYVSVSGEPGGASCPLCVLKPKLLPLNSVLEMHIYVGA